MIWAYCFNKKYAVEVLRTRAEFNKRFGPIFLPKSRQLRFFILELNLTDNLGLFFTQKYAVHFYILKLNFTDDLGLSFTKK